jgi:hypothetical protein
MQTIVSAGNNRSVNRFLFSLSLLLCVLVISIYAGLIPLSLWWADEYAVLPSFSGNGGGYLGLLYWIPRPFSNALIAIYAFFVNQFHSQFIVPTLSILWLTTLLCVISPPLFRLKNAKSSTLVCLLLSLSLFAACLQNHPIREMFYWPFGAFAYLPTLAGLCITMWIYILSERSKKSYLICAISLMIAATSSEIGAMTVATLIGMQVFLGWIQYSKKLIPIHIQAAWLFLPFFSAVSVLVAVSLGRVGSVGEVYGDPDIAHNLFRALKPSIETFLHDFFFSSEEHLPLLSGFLTGFAVKLLYLLGVMALFTYLMNSHKVKINQALSGLLAFVFALSAFLVVLAGYYQYGLNCCERHSTFKDCLILLSLFCFGAYLAAALNNRIRFPVALGSTLITVSLSIGLASAYSNISSAYSGFSSKQAMNERNWKQGGSTNPILLFEQRDDPIVGGLIRPHGIYHLGADTDWGLAAIMRFHNKQSIEIISYDNRSE